jgi:hypothetical protein
MAEALTKGKIVDNLPSGLRAKVIDMLIADVASRKIAAYITEHGYKITHNAVAEYRRETLPKHLETARKLQQLQQFETVGNDTVESLASITNQQLAADPLISRLERKYERYDTLTGQAVQAKDFAGFASIDRAETQAMRLHAELTGRLTEKQSSLSVQLVFANATEHSPKYGSWTIAGSSTSRQYDSDKRD